MVYLCNLLWASFRPTAFSQPIAGIIQKQSTPSRDKFNRVNF